MQAQGSIVTTMGDTTLSCQSTGSGPRAEPYQMGCGVGRNKRAELKPHNHFLPQARLGSELYEVSFWPWIGPDTAGKMDIGWESSCSEIFISF